MERTEETRIDPLVFRRTLGRFASGITVITTTHEGEGRRTTDRLFHIEAHSEIRRVGDATCFTELTGPPAPPPGPQERARRRRRIRSGHPGVGEHLPEAFYAANEERESSMQVLFDHALQKKSPLVVQKVSVSLVDGAEDDRLQKPPLVLDEQEVHGPPTLGRRPLERLQEPCGAGTRPMGQGEHPRARDYAEILECPAVRD